MSKPKRIASYAAFDSKGRIMIMAGRWKFPTVEHVAQVLSWYPGETGEIAPVTASGSRIR